MLLESLEKGKDVQTNPHSPFLQPKLFPRIITPRGRDKALATTTPAVLALLTQWVHVSTCASVARANFEQSLQSQETDATYEIKSVMGIRVSRCKIALNTILQDKHSTCFIKT